MNHLRACPRPVKVARTPALPGVLGLLVSLLFAGCYTPLVSPGIPARQLPDEYRFPARSAGVPINYATLTLPQPADYILGPGDVLDVIVPDLFRDAIVHPIRLPVMSDGNIQLPLVGPVRVGGMNLLQAQQTVDRAYADGIFKDPRVNVVLFERATVSVLVMGAVNAPGTHLLPKYQNDIGHAIAAAGGFNDDAGVQVEVHRRSRTAPPLGLPRAAEKVIPASYEEPADAPTAVLGDAPIEGLPGPTLIEGPPPLPGGQVGAAGYGASPHACGVVPPQGGPVTYPTGPETNVLNIPLRGMPGYLSRNDIALGHGDVVVVPHRRNEVFFVVGPLAQTNFVRFTVRERERELGAGFILPKDRDIDVVTAVAMAGYIDPIASPKTVTVHRTLPDGSPMLIRVDLIAARLDRRETVMVAPGDIIYLNPDARWWFQRQFDRVVPDIFLIPFDQVTRVRWILAPLTRQ